MYQFLCLLLAMTWANLSIASNEVTFVLEIPKTFYDHPSHLMHPRVDHWHNRGKEAEKAALATFTAKQYTVSRCEVDAHGKAFILILPSMFYNPQNEIFHSEITAKIYTNAGELSGQPTLVLKGEGQSRGWLSPNPGKFTFESYQKAFEDVIQQLQSNSDFLKSINEKTAQDFKAMCKTVDALPQQSL